MSDSITKMKVVKLIKEINRPKEDIINYLNTIGMDKVTVNTTLESDVVAKVYNHFKRDLEVQEKHLKKIVDFAKINKVEISEANEVIKKEEDDRKRREQEKLLQKNLEEQRRRDEELRKRQEQLAFEEYQNRIKKENEEKAKATAKKKQETEKQIAERQKNKEAEEKKKNGTKEVVQKQTTPAPDTNLHKKTKWTTDKESVKHTQDTKKTDKQQSVPVPHIITEKDFPKSSEHKKSESSKPAEHKRKPFTPSDRKDKPPQTKRPERGKDTRPATPRKEGERPRHDRPFNRTGKFEKVTIKDTGKPKKKFTKDGKKKEFTPHIPPVIPPTTDKDLKKTDKTKDKVKKSDVDFEKKKKKTVKIQKVKDFSQKDIDEAIRDTFAKIGDESGASARSIARKRKKRDRIEQEIKDNETKEARKNVLSVTEFISTVEFANLMGVPVTDIIKKCFDLNMMVSINQRLDKDLLSLVAEEFGYKIEFLTEFEEDVITDKPDAPETLKFRPPVVTVMGHVDHGKTSLLDYVRKANVVAGEAGGITQHIGAYKVKVTDEKEITFLDTPGHEAFTAMRARGGQAADIVVLVVAADDSVMPQTIEAINHAQAAGVPIVIAINKIDKPDSNIERIKTQLAERNVLIEEWGGKYQSVEISAKKGINMDILLEKILLEAEILELKANPDREARGVVLESKLDKGRGSVATVLVQKGTLKVGDAFIAGIFSGKVRAMFDERDKKIEEAGPSTPVQVTGFEGLPQAGDIVIALKSDADAKQIALKRQQLKREQELRQIKHTTLEDITEQIKQGKAVELNIILKTDVDGSGEALADSLHKLSKPGTATVRVIHKAVGQISESDVLLAEASHAVIIGFNVRPNLNARKLAEKNNVEIRIHNIIYAAIDEVKQVLEGMLAPEINEEIVATVEVREVFKVPKIGNIAGCYVQDGKINRNTKVRLLRDGLEIYNGSISSLKRMKDDVREVETGYECGIGLENFSDIKVGDIIEGYKLNETKRKL